jgi:hypothetical protein
MRDHKARICRISLLAMAIGGLGGCATTRAGSDGAPPPEPPATMPPPPPSPPPRLQPRRAAPPIHYQVRVLGVRVEQFHYVRQDLYRRLGGSDAQRVASMERSGNFGPRPIGAVVAVTPAQPYYFFPVCGGRLSITRRLSAQSNWGETSKTIGLSCLP